MKRLKHVLTAMLMLWLAAGCKDAASSQQQQQEDARQHLETLIQPYLDQMQQIEHVIYSDTVLGREVPPHTQRKACYSQTSVVCVKKSSQKFYYKTEP